MKGKHVESKDRRSVAVERNLWKDSVILFIRKLHLEESPNTSSPNMAFLL